jgi:hypothetical protein
MLKSSIIFSAERFNRYNTKIFFICRFGQIYTTAVEGNKLSGKNYFGKITLMRTYA